MMNMVAVPMLVGRLGFTEILIIVLIVFVLFGPKYLPKISKKVGESLHDWKEVGDKAGQKAPAPDGIVEVEPIEVVKVMTVENTESGEPQAKVIEVIDVK